MSHAPELAHVVRTKEQLNGVAVERMVVTCSCCGTGYTFPYWPPTRFAKSLSQRGWRDAANPKRATCSACIASGKAAKSESKKEAPVAKDHIAITGVVKIPTAAEAPRMPTRHENRLIIDALGDAYNEADGCYVGEMTDARLAEKLNLPRAWVAAVREQFYGPDISEARKRMPAEMANFERRLKMLEDESLSTAATAEKLGAEVRAYLAKIGGAA